VVLVPEAGDEVQTMKSGLMEIADIFVVNKADRPGADIFVKNLRQMLAPAFATHSGEIPVIKTVASQKEGITELRNQIEAHAPGKNRELNSWLLAEKAYQLLRNKKMSGIKKETIKETIEKEGTSFNLYRFVENFG
jgi:LAO/AO transport system kinase